MFNNIILGFIFCGLILAASGASYGTTPILPPGGRLASDIVLVFEIKERAILCNFKDIQITLDEWKEWVIELDHRYDRIRQTPRDLSQVQKMITHYQKLTLASVQQDKCGPRALSNHEHALSRVKGILEMLLVYNTDVSAR